MQRSCTKNAIENRIAKSEATGVHLFGLQLIYTEYWLKTFLAT
jgi:hypothetical protein